LVRDFVNTWDAEADTDAFAEAGGVRAWLAGRGLIGPDQEVRSEEAEQVQLLRAALHRLILQNGEAMPMAPKEAASIDTQLAALPMRLAVGPERLVLTPVGGSPVRAATGELLLTVAYAVAEGTWPRLKCCRSRSCRWVFYDASPGLSARWCSMRICGAREKARRYRHRAASQSWSREPGRSHA
jgi:predicted RNA-binding Zn ribbon-like protein